MSNEDPEENFDVVQRNSEILKRRRTDVLCVFLASIFLALCIGLSIALNNNDNLVKLKNPSDSSGKICGKDYPEHPFIYLTNLPDISRRVCLSACPKATDITLKCKPLPSISCSFSQNVWYIDTLPKSNHNGNICMPIDPKQQKDFKLDSRVSFFNPFIQLTYKITIILSITLMALMNHFSRGTMEAVQYVSLISELMLGIIVYIDRTDHTGVKSLLICVLAAAFVITVSQILIFRQELRVSRVFMVASSKFCNENKFLLVYILFFEIMLDGLFLLLLEIYKGLASSAPPVLDAHASLYYQPNIGSQLLAIFILIVFGFWSFSIIQQIFNFIISAHTINWYLKIPNDCQSVLRTLKLLFKHMGSVIASAFVNGFLFFPQAIINLIRSCRNNKQKSNNWLLNMIDLARGDTLSFIILNDYCEYLWRQSMISDQTQSSIPIYKLAAHMLIATIGSIICLFLRSELDPDLLAFTLIIGMFIGTFFIEFNAVSCQTLQLLYIMEEQFYKRREGRAKITSNVQDKEDQIRFIEEAKYMFSDQGVGAELSEIRKEYWKLNIKQKATDRNIPTEPFKNEILKGGAKNKAQSTEKQIPK